ncbi:MAG: hypothetical protein ABDH61_01545 [Acidilobaceae archaeon]
MSSEDPRGEAIKLLRVLSYHYSFRDLEKLLGIHFQSLWRYATLNSVPEKETAEKILTRAAEADLVKSVIDSFLNKSGEEYHVLLRFPGFVSAFAHISVNALGESDLDAAIALSPEALTIATAIAMDREALICHLRQEARLERGGLLAFHYKSRREKSIRSLVLPKECLEESSVALVDVVLDPDKVLALEYLARKNRAKISLVSAISGDKESIEELGHRLNGTKIVVMKVRA